MSIPNIYIDKDKNKVSSTDITNDYYIGYADGVFDTLAQLPVEVTLQTASENNYLSMAKKNQEWISLIMGKYNFIDEESVNLFLHEQPSIIDLVNETYSKIYEFIPEIDNIVLEVLIDPEDNQKNLIAKVYSDLSIDDALDKLDDFDKRWFASKFIDSDMTFNLSLDFKE